MPRTLFSTDEPSSGRFARVVLERGLDDPEGLTYSIPQHLADLAVGQRITAPLGRSDRPTPGYVVEIVTDPGLDPGRIKPVLARTGTGLPAPLMDLARWMARYYCCPFGMVLATMLPAAVKRGTGRVRRTMLTRAGALPDPATLAPSARAPAAAIGAMEDSRFPVAAKVLALALGLRTVAPINRLVRAGYLKEVEVESVRGSGSPWEEPAEPPGPRPVPTPAQAAAIGAMSGALGRFAPFLLFGVTGSGKTEVYLGVLERALARGEGAIVLVPEISLTPQTASRFTGRFRDAGVAILHSGLTDSQRHEAWRRIASGRARIVVGARSAVFAPFDAARGVKLGAIIIDEEHDHSYKQDQLPRYHARDVAVKRAQLEGCPVVLGSATPSLESWFNATADPAAAPQAPGPRPQAHPRFTLLALPHRVGGGTLPRVEVVDFAAELRARAHTDRHVHAIGPTLQRALGAALDRPGAQAILLLNRRGYASYICCVDPACGWYMTCEHCDVTVVYHKRTLPPIGAARASGVVRCHHCLAEFALPPACPRCRRAINTFGFGTQRLEEELARKFPVLRAGDTMLRLDRDTMTRAADYFHALERFRTGGARVLLGTQMIAKGLDFPHVELVGVINADSALSLPDFRATERTFQLVSQVAGRAGRSAASERAARVIIQTFNPREPAIECAARHDFEAFAAREIETRASAGLPPLGRMARIVCRDRNPARAEARAAGIAEALRLLPSPRPGGATALRLRGPMPCPLSRLAGYYRFAVELLAPSAPEIQRALSALRAAGLVKSDAHTAVDVDPVALL